MRYVINILLLLAIVGLGYLLFGSIKTPIEFRSEKKVRKDQVTDRLNDIRKCQEMYRDITGEFAPTFDSLVMVLKTDSIPFQQVFEDPNDPTNEDKFVYKTIYSNALDSLMAMNISLDSLRYIPFANGKEFNINADTLTYQKTVVWVTECGTRYNEFMGRFADAKYAKYDDSYDPAKSVKFGDMGKPSLSGNWE